MSAVRARSWMYCAAVLLMLAPTLAWPQEPLPAPVLTAKGSQLYLPTQRGESMPVVILLPYTGSTARRLLEWVYRDSLLQTAAAEGYAVLLPSPAGRRSDYANSTVWLATLERYRQLLAADVDELAQIHGADPARIVLAGFSMGGDLAWATLQRDPERYAGALVMGSRASYRDDTAMQRLAQRGVRLFLFMGDSESPNRLAGMRSAIGMLEAATIEHRYERAPGGHLPAPPQMLLDAIRWLIRSERDEAGE